MRRDGLGLFLAIISLLSALCLAFCMAWMGIEFLIYLIKDTPLNWWSAWIGAGCLGVFIISYGVTIKRSI